MNESKKHVENLIQKAVDAATSIEALQFSQAACNAANAMAVLHNIEHQASHKESPETS